MRRNDHDVTDSIRTTGAATVGAEVLRIGRTLFQADLPAQVDAAFLDVEAFYAGRHPEYFPCDTAYHDLQHALDVALAMARLLDGYERGRTGGEERLTREAFALGIVSALFHDIGYLRLRNDRRHRFGAEYTLTHVSRGAAFLRAYVRGLGFGADDARAAAVLVHFTGYERAPESIRIGDALLRRVGHMLGSADILAQMADRCYLEKCRERLYPEFVLGRLAGRRRAGLRTLPLFNSPEELVCKTPIFYDGALKRLRLQLGEACRYAATHFGGDNPYLDEMEKNVRYAGQLTPESMSAMLRRQAPVTLAPGVQPYPKDLAGI